MINSETELAVNLLLMFYSNDNTFIHRIYKLIYNKHCFEVLEIATNELSVTYEVVLTLVRMLHLLDLPLANWLHADRCQRGHNSETEHSVLRNFQELSENATIHI